MGRAAWHVEEPDGLRVHGIGDRVARPGAVRLCRDPVRASRIRKSVTYGWGVVPVEATIDGVRFETSLFPREGTYLLPLKLAVRKRTGVTVGDVVCVTMTVGRAPREPDF